MRLAWKQIVVSLLIGLFLGVAVSPFIHRRMPLKPMPIEQKNERLLKKFTEKLALSEEQRVKVAAVLDQKRQRLEAMREEDKPKFEQIRTETNQAIRALLTPDQQVKFDEMKAKWDAKRQKREESWKK